MRVQLLHIKTHICLSRDITKNEPCAIVPPSRAALPYHLFEAAVVAGLERDRAMLSSAPRTESLSVRVTFLL